MAEKRLNTRIVHKHETEANWLLATNFIPMQGEIIIYDIDSTHNYERVKVGDGKTLVSALPFIDANKVDKVAGKCLSTNDYTTTEKNKLAGIAEGANKTIVDGELSSTSTNPVQNKAIYAKLDTLIGGTSVSTQINNAIANKVDKVTGKGLSTNDYTTDEKNKLSGISAGAEVNQNAFSNVIVGSTTITADAKTDSLTLVAGSNITLTPDATNDKITIAATDTVYTHPTYTAKNSGLYKITVDGTGHVSGATAVTKSDITGLGIPAQDTTYSSATQSSAGLMSAADKVTLDTLDSYVGDKKVSDAIDEAFDNAITGLSVSGKVITYTKGDGTTGTITTQDTDTKYTHPTTSGNKHIPSGGASGQILRWSADGTAVWGEDNNTTYSAGTGISFSGTTINNSGVRGVSTGSTNGTISVNTNGTSADVAVKGLGSAAYTASTAYDAAGKADAALTNAKSYTDAEITEWVGDKKVSEQIAAANMIYVGPNMPTDSNIKVWINTAEEGAGVIPVLPRVSTITLNIGNWTGAAAPYSQVVNINTVTTATKVELNPTVSQIISLQNDDVALMADNDGGVVTIYSFGGKPSTNMTMQVTLTEVSYV